MDVCFGIVGVGLVGWCYVIGDYEIFWYCVGYDYVGGGVGVVIVCG